MTSFTALVAVTTQAMSVADMADVRKNVVGQRPRDLGQRPRNIGQRPRN